MYSPSVFKQLDEKRLSNFIADYPLATVVCATPLGLEANLIPLYYSDKQDKAVLQGHIAKANPLWKQVDTQAEVLTFFQGPQSYVSPNWYLGKKEHGKVVPTWNYASVQIKGEISFIDDSSWKLAMLNRLTDKSEKGQAQPWKVADAPLEFINKQLGAIVGIEISVTSMHGKWKMSQNKSDKDRERIIEGLKETDMLDSKAASIFMNNL